MTREEHLKFCKQCTNRHLDMKVGLVCNLTGIKADFSDECTSFEKDNSVIEQLEDTEILEHNELLYKLSPETLSKFKEEQDYSKALVSGIIVGLIGAFLWGAITVSTGYQIGYMALAIGAGVGLSMRYTGKGIDKLFGITGGIIALLSCLLGNFLSIVGFLAEAENLGYMETLSLINYSELLPIMVETFSPIDLLFYAIAAAEGYKLSFRALTEKELHEIESKHI
ncbi:hypothetical protein [Mangrovimonas sp. TPBH4]|uniref:hypothetical protein n=1 Tax=Mangrovimonas sp. TPBH4 TaxID=1645914 RepID=UPI0006B5DC92|nr:hypothetical protein [Mangrovimonas sp. TPBH4]